MRLFSVLAGIATALAIQGAAKELAAELGPNAGYVLTASCSWHAAGWAAAVHAPTFPRATRASEAAEERCLQARGLKSPSPFVKIIVRRFPHQNEGPEDASRNTLPADPGANRIP